MPKPLMPAKRTGRPPTPRGPEALTEEALFELLLADVHYCLSRNQYYDDYRCRPVGIGHLLQSCRRNFDGHRCTVPKIRAALQQAGYPNREVRGWIRNAQLAHEDALRFAPAGLWYETLSRAWKTHGLRRRAGNDK